MIILFHKNNRYINLSNLQVHLQVAKPTMLSLKHKIWEKFEKSFTIKVHHRQLASRWRWSWLHHRSLRMMMVRMRRTNLVVHAWAIEHTGLPTCVPLIEIVVDGITTTTCFMEQQEIQQFKYGQNNYKSFNYLLQSLQDNSLKKLQNVMINTLSSRMLHDVLFIWLHGTPK